MTTEAERNARDALAWAIEETVLRLPPSLRHPDGWKWDGGDMSFRRLTDDGEFRFHIAAERRGARTVRIAVMSICDDHGSATWEAEIGPAALRAQENRDG